MMDFLSSYVSALETGTVGNDGMPPGPFPVFAGTPEILRLGADF